MKWLSRLFGGKRAARRFRPRLELLESRDVPTVTYHGGFLLPNVEVQGLYVGSDWYYDPNTARFEGFLNYIVNSPYMDMLNNAGYGVGRGSASPGLIDPAYLPPGSTVFDSQLRYTLQAEIFNGALQQPDFDRLYVIFVQANVIVTNDISGGSSSRNEPNGFVGYHSSFVGSNAFGVPSNIRYAVVVTPGGQFNGLSSALPAFDQMTSVASHELAEAVTDPDPGSGWVDDFTGQEIGDVHANDDVYLNHYVVQIEADQNDGPLAPPTLTYQAAEFPGAGVWRFANGWQQLTPSNASTVDADANGDVVADFPGAGVWRFEDATGWVRLTPSDTTELAMSGAGIVAAEFPGAGVWRYEDQTGWRQLTPANATQVAVDLYGNVLGDFPGGLFRYDDFRGWVRLTSAQPATIAIGDNGVVAASFANGVFRYEDGVGWQHLTTVNASSIGVDAVGNVVGEFNGFGVYRYEDATGWQQLTATNATGLAAGAVSEVVATFPNSGLWLYDDVYGWRQLTPSGPSVFAIGA
jgi:hypothetical protein